MSGKRARRSRLTDEKLAEGLVRVGVSQTEFEGQWPHLHPLAKDYLRAIWDDVERAATYVKGLDDRELVATYYAGTNGVIPLVLQNSQRTQELNGLVGDGPMLHDDLAYTVLCEELEARGLMNDSS